MLRHTGMCHPNGLLFHQKYLDMGPILVKKSLEEGPISQKLKKNVKSAVFDVYETRVYILGFASLNGTFHLSPHENVCTIALINIHYLCTVLYHSYTGVALEGVKIFTFFNLNIRQQ